jgi:hypothetical protein
VLAFGIKSTLGWFLLIAATLFCIASIWLDSVPLGFNIWLGAFLSMIYLNLVTKGKHGISGYSFEEERFGCGPLHAASLMDDSDHAIILPYKW